MLTKGLKAEVRNKLDRCLSDIAEQVAASTVSNNDLVHVVKMKTKPMVAK